MRANYSRSERTVREGIGSVACRDIIVDKQGHVGLIRLGRPEAMNALNGDVIRADKESAIRAVPVKMEPLQRS